MAISINVTHICKQGNTYIELNLGGKVRVRFQDDPNTVTYIPPEPDNHHSYFDRENMSVQDVAELGRAMQLFAKACEQKLDMELEP